MYGSGWKKTAVRGEVVGRGEEGKEEKGGRRGRRRKEEEGGGRRREGESQSGDN